MEALLYALVELVYYKWAVAPCLEVQLLNVIQDTSGRTNNNMRFQLPDNAMLVHSRPASVTGYCPSLARQGFEHRKSLLGQLARRNKNQGLGLFSNIMHLLQQGEHIRQRFSTACGTEKNQGRMTPIEAEHILLHGV
jgi:hypothetical protein